jgi:hypothetical protein
VTNKGKLSYLRSVGLLFLTFSLVTLFQNCGSQFDTSQTQSNSANESNDPGLQCDANMHPENNVCTSDKRECPVANGTGEETWNGFMYGACTIVTCDSGYNNQSNTCVFSPSSCPIANGNGQTQSNGSCQVVSCNANFHMMGNSCVSNTQTCPITNGTGLSTWNGTSFGVCTVASCNTGYSISTTNTCVANPPVCSANMHLENNVCVNNRRTCPIANGAGEQTWNGSAYGNCTVVSCNSGYQNQSNSCVFSPMSCPIANGTGQTQSNGSCQVVSCNTNYHINGNMCSPNIQLCPIANGAGQSVWNGTSYGPCTVLSCNTGYVNTNNMCVASPPPGSGTWTARNTSRFFISGHSLTDDPLAEYIVDIATKRGDTVAYNEQIIIGSAIGARTKGDNIATWAGYRQGKNRNGSFGLNVISELRNPQTIGAGQRYDTLVITENHHLPVAIQWEDTIGLFRHFHDRLIEGNPAARSMFYNSWLDINKNDPSIWIDYEKKALVAWECTTSKINLSLQAAGRSDRTVNLPVGAALVDLVERAMANQVAGISGTTLQKMNMIFSDNVHLTPLGTYYAALVTYSSIYAKTASGLTPPSGVNATTAAALQTIAWNFVNSYYNRSNPGLRDMAECRTHLTQQVCPALWILKNETFRTQACQNYYSSTTSSPFRWPDSSFVLYPTPP